MVLFAIVLFVTAWLIITTHVFTAILVWIIYIAVMITWKKNSKEALDRAHRMRKKEDDQNKTETIKQNEQKIDWPKLHDYSYLNKEGDDVNGQTNENSKNK